MTKILLGFYWPTLVTGRVCESDGDNADSILSMIKRK